MHQATAPASRSATYIIWVAIALLGFSGSVHAACSASPDVILNFPAPSSLSIPRDAAEGTVLHRERIGVKQILFNCTTSELWGVRVAEWRGKQPAPGAAYIPTGSPGLSFRVQVNGALQYYIPALEKLAAGGYTIDGSIILEIVKSGELAPSKSINAGSVGTVVFGPTRIMSISLANAVNVVTSSCESPSVNVEMGDDYRVFQLDTPGISPRSVPFNLRLVNCPSGISKVNYQLRALTPIVDAAQGVVELNDLSSASGIGLQVKDGNGNPLALNVPHNFPDYNSKGGSFLIPLSASYYRLKNTPIRPGTANTELTFIMSYL